jgi:hypothetical protein
MKRVYYVLAAALLLAATIQARACLVQLTIEAASGDQTGSWTGTVNTVYSPELQKDVWQTSNIIFGAAQDSFGIESLLIKTLDDPEVSIEFAARAGSEATSFHFVVNPVNFDPITNPDAYASGGVTLTDRTPSGAVLTGLFGSKIFRASYNNNTLVYADLVNGKTVSGGKTVYTGEDVEGGIIGTVTNINIEASFLLSAFDNASGTATFVVTPEPATMTILGLGVLAFFRRK